jgi:hypothetical protein
MAIALARNRFKDSFYIEGETTYEPTDLASPKALAR